MNRISLWTRTVATFLLTVVLGVVAERSGWTQEPTDPQLENTALQFISALMTGNQDALVKNFEYIEQMKTFISSDEVLQLPASIIEIYGKMGKCTQTKVVPYEQFRLVYLYFEGEKAPLKMHVTFIGNQIAGFFLDPEDESTDPDFQQQQVKRKAELTTASLKFIDSVFGRKESMPIQNFPYTSEMKKAFLDEKNAEAIPQVIDEIFGTLDKFIVSKVSRMGKYETVALYYQASKEPGILLITWEDNKIAGFHLDSWVEEEQPASEEKK